MQEPKSHAKAEKERVRKRERGTTPPANNTQVAAAHSDVRMQEASQRRRRKEEKGMKRTKGPGDEVTMGG